MSQLKINANVGKVQSNTESPKDGSQQQSQEDHDLGQKVTSDVKHVKGSTETTNDLPVVDFDSGQEIGRASSSIEDVLI